eukprot:5591736-Prymnesium_polylepis.1
MDGLWSFSKGMWVSPVEKHVGLSSQKGVVPSDGVGFSGQKGMWVSRADANSQRVDAVAEAAEDSGETGTCGGSVSWLVEERPRI